MLRKSVRLTLSDAQLSGDLIIPKGAKGLVIFAHGSGSSRHSPRNKAVADALNRQGLGTLLIDLLTAEEEKIDTVTREIRFNIPLLSKRLSEMISWVLECPETQGMNIGLFGSSTGAAAALIAAAQAQSNVKAIVSRGGRPDLAEEALPSVLAATLLIVGELDQQVLALNRFAYEMLGTTHKELSIIPGATHLFEEPRALDQVAKLAADWFVSYLLPIDDEPVL